jgi:hypothetical protein
MVRDLRLMKSVLALTLTAVAAVTVNAQIVANPPPPPQGYCTGGPFTLTAVEEARFYIGLDDTLPALPMKVTLRFYDAHGDGTAVASRTVTALPARNAATLEFHGSGLFYVQASFDSLLNPTDRRETFGLVEVFDVDRIRAVIPVKCLPNERIVD